LVIALTLLMGLAGCSTMATPSVKSADQLAGLRTEPATSLAGAPADVSGAGGAAAVSPAASEAAASTAASISTVPSVPPSTAPSAVASAADRLPLSPSTVANPGVSAASAASDVAPAAPLVDSGPVPRVEPPHPGSNRPYVVRGQQIVPLAMATEHRERGVASWYGHPFHGRATASGERFDMHALSAAHKTLPIPSYLRVTHVRSGRNLVVRVNDRGPFASDRVLDLSYAAAQRLGFAQHGTAEVQIELLASPRGFSQATLAARAAAAAAVAQSTRPLEAAPPMTVALDEVRALQPQPGALAGDGPVFDDPKSMPKSTD
jgi:rare lipoprotein A